MKKKMMVLAAVVLAVSFLMGTCPVSSEAAGNSASIMDSKKPVKWRFAHAAYEGELACRFAEQVIVEIEKAFDGKLEIAHFPAGQLGSYVSMQEALQNGVIQLNMPVTPSLGQIVPGFKFTSINFILSEHYDVNDRALNEGKAFQLLEKELESQNIKIIRWFLEDFSCWTSNYPIQKLEDLEGLKMRVYPSTQIVANYRAVKANPTEIPYAEVYSALQLNVADAQENPISIICNNKFYEVQKYVIESNHSGIINGVAMQKSFWDNLAEEDRLKIEEAVAAATDYAQSIMWENLENAKEEIRASGNTTILQLDPEERKRMAEASFGARDAFLKDTGDHGKEIINLWLEDIKKYEEELIKK